MNRLFLLTSLMALILLAAPAGADEWRAPEGAQIMVAGRVLPPPPETRRWMERVKGYPVVVRALEVMRDETGVDLEDDVLSWMEGRAYVAQVRDGEYSPLSEMVWQDHLQSRYNRVISQMWTLNGDLESYKGEKGDLPATLEGLAPDHLSDDSIDLSRFRYERKAGGDYRLEAVFPKDSTLAGLQPPVFDQTGLVESHEPEDAPPNLVVAFSVTDPALARKKLEFLKEKLGLGADAVPVVEVRNEWLMAADNVRLLDRVAPALAGRSPQNRRLADLLKRVPRDPDLQVFVDIPDVLDHWREADLPEEALPTLKSFQGFLLTSYASEEKVVTEAFLAIAPPQGHPLAALLEGPPDTRIEMADRLPWSISYVDVYNVREVVKAADQVAETHPMLRMGMSLLRGRVESAVGLSVDKDLLPASTGEAALNMELVDLVGSMIISGFDEATRKPDMEPDSTEKSDEKSEEPTPEDEGLKFDGPLSEIPDMDGLGGLDKVPFTVVVGIKPGPARDKVLAALDLRVGKDARTEVYRGREIRQAADKHLAYTVRGSDVIVAFGPTVRLLKALVDGMDGQVPSLAKLNSFQDFRSGLQGRLVAFRHSKADSLYSIAKGLLLTLGAEFRTEADHLGLWRDAYASVTLEPAGVRFRGALYATDQVP